MEPLIEIVELISLIGVEIERTLSVTGSDADDPEDRAVLDRLAVALCSLTPTERPEPVLHPAVGRWLDEAVAASPAAQRPLADAFGTASPHLVWKTAYAGAPSSPEMRHFWSNYSFAPLASPPGAGGAESPLLSDEMNLYLVIHGSNVEYGRHHHPAIEVYGIVSGTGRWLRGGEGFRARGPGDVFVHRPDVVHATTTGLEPTISWVAWLGDLESQPVLETANGATVTV